ncbi:hypothetical protein [Neptuniibacter sp. QD37_11]|uniref:hypothetical protein n=1 Tax=Neptuniibacter sp. QD37_11 TaxID=3398209 RepID=UPI0039F61387
MIYIAAIIFTILAIFIGFWAKGNNTEYFEPKKRIASLIIFTPFSIFMGATAATILELHVLWGFIPGLLAFISAEYIERWMLYELKNAKGPASVFLDHMAQLDGDAVANDFRAKVRTCKPKEAEGLMHLYNLIRKRHNLPEIDNGVDYLPYTYKDMVAKLKAMDIHFDNLKDYDGII